MEKQNNCNNDQLDTTKILLQTYDLIPSRQQHNSWVGNIRKSGRSGRYSNNSTIRIDLQWDRESLQYSKRYIHHRPNQSLQNTQHNISQVMKNTSITCKHVLKSAYQHYIQQYSQKNIKFTDSQFPPIQKSIGQSLPVYKWKRISQIIQNPQFVSQIIEPSDVLQGEIGDCYFLSAVAALAQYDYRIKNIFPSLQIQKNGIYMARILHQGILRQVVVDDYIPVKPDNKPVFAKPSAGKQIWVVILQKCWAKLYGSYQAIVGGLPHEVLHAFSGAPTYYNHIPDQKADQQALFQKINASYQNGDILCCGTKPNHHVQEKGLVRGHAYTILGIFKTPHKLLKLRNPWGQKSWTGRASQKDFTFWSTLPQQFKQRIGFIQYSDSNIPDGIFFMLWEDFVQLFQMIDVCRIRDNASYFCHSATFSSKNGKFFQFQLMQSALVTIAISQKSLRGASIVKMKTGYSKTTLVLAKATKINNVYEYKFIKSNQNLSFPDHYLDAHLLTQGKYVFFAKADWIGSKKQRATVSIYTQAKVNLHEVESQKQHQKFLFKVFLNHARRNLNRRLVINQQPLQWICSDFLVNQGSYGYSVYHVDKNSPYRLCIQFDEQDFKKQNLILKKPYKNNGKIKTTVKPGQQLIILFRLRPYYYTQQLTIPIPKVYKY